MNKKAYKYSIIVCITILMVFFASVLLRSITSHLLVDKLNFDNEIIHAIFFDNKELRLGNKKNDFRKSRVGNIDWSTQYPFDESIKIENDDNRKAEEEIKKSSLYTKFSNKLSELNEKCQDKKEILNRWTTNKLMGYMYIIELSKKYDSIIKWNIVDNREYNGVMKLEDGHLVSFSNRKDMSQIKKNIVELNGYCKNKDIEFIYVSAPGKFNKNEEKYNSLDFSNENADDVLAGLKENNVRYIDIRENIEEQGWLLRDLFFKTDHHWLPETGFWATGIIAEYLNNNNIAKCDLSLLDMKKYHKVVYENMYIGSRGKKNLAISSPEDISLIYPDFKTEIRYKIPSMNMDKTGDFSIMYDMECLNPEDEAHPFSYEAYFSYNYGDVPCISIENMLPVNDKKVLIIKDSFANTINPFLAIQFKHTDILDVRCFDGSVHNFIKVTKPDVVIVLCYIEDLSDFDQFDSHESLWNFE